MYSCEKGLQCIEHEITHACRYVYLPVAVIVVFVVAPQSSQRPQTDGIGEEDLGASVNPHLSSRGRELGQKG